MEKKIRQYLGEQSLVGRTLLCFDEIGSTNTHLKCLALEGAEDGTAVIAAVQTAGRGRMDRSFQSPKGKGIYLSVLLRPEVPMERLMCVTALAGVAVCDAVEELCGVRPGLKWPNDPVLGNQKLCGILTELVMMPDGTPAVVLGIGLNVLQSETDFSPEVRPIATSLAMELGYAGSVEELAAALLRQLDCMYGALRTNRMAGYLSAYRKGCVHLGKQVRLIGLTSQETVLVLEIDEDFGLVVLGADGQRRTVHTGELSVRGLYGYAES